MALEKLVKTTFRSYRVDLKFPILFGVASILRGDRTPRDGLDALMRMPLRQEFVEGDAARGRRAVAPSSAAAAADADAADDFDDFD